ncbi:hypothetical protein LI291_07225 [Intestinibacillus massiliensis]|nr:hypothetical protein [Intestinibacillus massiliensis]
MKNNTFIRCAAGFLVSLSMVSMSAAASDTITEISETNQLEQLNIEGMALVQDLFLGKATPVIEDNFLTFDNNFPEVVAASSDEQYKFIKDVRVIGNIGGQDVFQATYGVMSREDQDNFYGTCAFLRSQYRELDDTSDIKYYKVDMMSAGSIDISGTSLIQDMRFGIHSMGDAKKSVNSPSIQNIYNQYSSRRPVVDNGYFYNMWNTDEYFYAATGIEGSVVSMEYKTSTSGSKYNMISMKFGMSDIA